MGFVLQDPEHSLLVLERILDNFVKVSGYRVNKVKSVMMGINMEEVVKDRISRITQVSWYKKTECQPNPGGKEKIF